MRHRPYSAIGIRRVPCLRCGRPSAHQWKDDGGQRIADYAERIAA